MAENREMNAIDAVRAQLPDEDTIYDLAEVFKVFGDSTRTKILSCLRVRDLYVGEMAEVLGMSVSAVSHQLRILRGAKLVKGEKQGQRGEIFTGRRPRHADHGVRAHAHQRTGLNPFFSGQYLNNCSNIKKSWRTGS